MFLAFLASAIQEGFLMEVYKQRKMANPFNKLFPEGTSDQTIDIYIREISEKNPDLYFVMSYPTEGGTLIRGIPKQASFDFEYNQ